MSAQITIIDNIFSLKMIRNNTARGKRRMIELDDKAKVVASVWGANFVHFLAALAVLPWSIWKKRLNLTSLF